MARVLVVPHPRKRKNAETQEYGIYDLAFLADRGCLCTAMRVKRKPSNVRPEQLKRA
jgi:hypothetical protein